MVESPYYNNYLLISLCLKPLEVHADFFPQIVNNICYFNLIVCCKTSEGRGGLEGPYFQITPFLVNLLNFKAIFSGLHDVLVF